MSFDPIGGTPPAPAAPAVQAQAHASRRTVRRGPPTHKRKHLIEARLEVARIFWANVTAFEQAWMRLRSRIGGFTDEDVDRILVDPLVYGNTYTAEENAHHFAMLRAFKSGVPLHWARFYAARSHDQGLSGLRIPVPPKVDAESIFPAPAPPAGAAAAAPSAQAESIAASSDVTSSASTSSSSESESDAEWVASRRRAEWMENLRGADRSYLAERAREHAAALRDRSRSPAPHREGLPLPDPAAMRDDAPAPQAAPQAPGAPQRAAFRFGQGEARPHFWDTAPAPVDSSRALVAVPAVPAVIERPQRGGPGRNVAPAAAAAPAPAAAAADADADEEDDVALQRAIAESLTDMTPLQAEARTPAEGRVRARTLSEYFAAAGPTPVPTHVIYVDRQGTVAAEADVPMYECVICEERRSRLYRVSFLCSHEYCADCLVHAFSINRGSQQRCPGCVAERHAFNQYAESAEFRRRFTFLTSDAVGVIDPHFMRLVPGVPELMKSGQQLDAFFPPNGSVYWSGTGSKCPHCRQRIVGTPNHLDALIVRCTRAECGAVFCNRCGRDWSPMHACDQRCLSTDAASLEEIRRTSKACPACGVSITHYREHGCHRIRCANPACKHRFCYLCLKKVLSSEEDPEDEALDSPTCRCPPFCARDGSCGCPPCTYCRPGHPCGLVPDHDI